MATELYEKIRETCKPHGEFKHSYWFFAETPNIAILALFEKNYDDEQILAVVSNIREDEQYRCFN
jgi:hypothetical protein